ncbi:MAG: sialate O-acetylesterase [Balneolaceae bacterium]
MAHVQTRMNTIPLIWMAGQSNMEGMGWNRELPAGLRGVPVNHWIYSPNRRKDGESTDPFTQWHPLIPGFGYGVSQDRRGLHLSDRFGVELSFSRRLMKLRPEAPLALLKVAKGGSSLHPDPPSDWGTWDPALDDRGIRNQFTYLREAATRCQKLPLPNTRLHIDPRPSLFIWIQGESDAAFNRPIAEAYEKHLGSFFTRVRNLANHPTLPILLVRLSKGGTLPNGTLSMPWAEQIRESQTAVASEDPAIDLVSIPEPVVWQDPWHYDSETVLKLGERLAERVNDFGIF